MPITLIARVPNMLVVNPAIPAKDVKELIVLLKANPTKYTFASSGNGTSQHLSGELFKSMAGVEMQHIPYKGSPPALQDVVGGQVTMTFDNITTALAARQGRQAARAGGDDGETLRRWRRTFRRSPSRGCRDSRSARGKECLRRRPRRPQSSSASMRKS